MRCNYCRIIGCRRHGNIVDENDTAVRINVAKDEGIGYTKLDIVGILRPYLHRRIDGVNVDSREAKTNTKIIVAIIRGICPECQGVPAWNSDNRLPY